MDDGSALHRSRLDEARVATTRRIRSLTKSFDEVVRAAADAATDDEHDPEGHTIAWERQQIGALIDSARAALAEILDAEARLAAGAYGACARCGRDIGSDRLTALPATNVCISCASGTTN